MKVKLELIIEEDEGSILESIEKIVDKAKEITNVVSAKSDDLYYQAPEQPEDFRDAEEN